MPFFLRLWSGLLTAKEAKAQDQEQTPLSKRLPAKARSNSQLSPLAVTVPNRLFEGSHHDDRDSLSYLSSSASSDSSCQTLSSLESEDLGPQAIISAGHVNHGPENTYTTETLAALLRDFHVQSHHDWTNVPLKTFRTFEAPPLTTDLAQDDCNSWFLWETPPREWVQSDEPQNFSPPSTSPAAPSPSSLPHTTDAPSEPLRLPYQRSHRENPDHLRMIAAELNMMRADKLIGPLKPRAYLIKRSDLFQSQRPSSLRAEFFLHDQNP